MRKDNKTLSKKSKKGWKKGKKTLTEGNKKK
jgi:hypothetical protein